jgi:hypothetical protein
MLGNAIRVVTLVPPRVLMQFLKGFGSTFIALASARPLPGRASPLRQQFRVIAADNNRAGRRQLLQLPKLPALALGEFGRQIGRHRPHVRQKYPPTGCVSFISGLGEELLNRKVRAARWVLDANLNAASGSVQAVSFIPAPSPANHPARISANVRAWEGRLDLAAGQPTRFCRVQAERKKPVKWAQLLPG